MNVYCASKNTTLSARHEGLVDGLIKTRQMQFIDDLSTKKSEKAIIKPQDEGLGQESTSHEDLNAARKCMHDFKDRLDKIKPDSSAIDSTLKQDKKIKRNFLP